LNPTLEQLNQWSAEAKGWTEKKGIPKDCCTFGHYWAKEDDTFAWNVFTWRPSTKLNLAWLEFSKSLEEEYFLDGCSLYLSPTGSGKFCEKTKKITWILTPKYLPEDKKAAYTLTYAFVQAMEPKSYLEWRSNENK